MTTNRSTGPYCGSSIMSIESFSRSSCLLWTCLCCTGASYSSGNGLLLWPVVIVLAISIGATKRDVIVVSAAAVLAIGLYFVGYRFTGHLKLRSAVTSPLYLLQYVASYLSMPFGGM